MTRNWAAECGVVIPCFNEATVIDSVTSAVRRYLPTVVVVDDGSSDLTASQAQGSGATVIRHHCRQGKGAALRTGLAWLVQRRFRWALLMDGDGQHAPDDIPIFLRQADQTEPAMVIGNRMVQAAGMPWLRRWVNRWMSARLSRLAEQPLPDSQCGFRLLHLAVWSGLDTQTSHFEIESELLLACLRAGKRVEFVPIRVIYGQERTKIAPIRDTWRWCRWWWSVSQAPVSGLTARCGNAAQRRELAGPAYPLAEV